MTVSATFGAKGVSNALLVRPGQTAVYGYVIDGADTFTGLVQLQRSRTGGLAWEPILELDGRTVALVAATVADVVLANETPSIEYYRWQCLDEGDANEIDVTLADVVDVEERKLTQAGVLVWTVNDDGSVTFTRITNLDALVTSAGFAAALLTAITALPTAEPAAGQLWLDGGVLTVSNGP